MPALPRSDDFAGGRRSAPGDGLGRRGNPVAAAALRRDSGGEGLGDLHELVEEELLLAIPLAPRHPEGECVLRQTVDSDDVADDDERENPFAVLAKIKGSSS